MLVTKQAFTPPVYALAARLPRRPAGLVGALAELVGNSLEAGASRIDVVMHVNDDIVQTVTVLDNGCGIPRSELARAL